MQIGFAAALTSVVPHHRENAIRASHCAPECDLEPILHGELAIGIVYTKVKIADDLNDFLRRARIYVILTFASDTRLRFQPTEQAHRLFGGIQVESPPF